MPSFWPLMFKMEYLEAKLWGAINRQLYREDVAERSVEISWDPQLKVKRDKQNLKQSSTDCLSWRHTPIFCSCQQSVLQQDKASIIWVHWHSDYMMRSPRLQMPSYGNSKALFLNPERTATPPLHLLKKHFKKTRKIPRNQANQLIPVKIMVSADCLSLLKKQITKTIQNNH